MHEDGRGAGQVGINVWNGRGAGLPADGGFLVRDPWQTAVHFTST